MSFEDDFLRCRERLACARKTWHELADDDVTIGGKPKGTYCHVCGGNDPPEARLPHLSETLVEKRSELQRRAEHCGGCILAICHSCLFSTCRNAANLQAERSARPRWFCVRCVRKRRHLKN